MSATWRESRAWDPLDPDQLTAPLEADEAGHWTIPWHSDLFADDATQAGVDAAFAVILLSSMLDGECRWNQFSVVTAHPERMAAYFASDPYPRWLAAADEHLVVDDGHETPSAYIARQTSAPSPSPLPIRCLRIGVRVSAGNDDDFYEMAKACLDIPAEQHMLVLSDCEQVPDLWKARFQTRKGGKVGAVTAWEGGFDFVVVEHADSDKEKYFDVARCCLAALVPVWMMGGKVDEAKLDEAVAGTQASAIDWWAHGHTQKPKVLSKEAISKTCIEPDIMTSYLDVNGSKPPPDEVEEEVPPPVTDEDLAAGDDSDDTQPEPEDDSDGDEEEDDDDGD